MRITNWQQVVIIVLYSLALYNGFITHGTYQRGKGNVWHSIIGVGIMLFLLITGGFFK